MWRMSDADNREAFELLELIDAEFQSDPTSVAPFDLRIVQRIRELVDRWQSAGRP